MPKIYAEKLSNCLAEQRRALKLLQNGHGDRRGLHQAIEDWVMEEVLIIQEQRTDYADRDEH